MNKYLMKRTLCVFTVILAAILQNACATDPQNTVTPMPKDPLMVKIRMDEKGCPVAVNPAKIELSRSKDQGIIWQAATGAGKPVDFAVFFNPFAGKSEAMLSVEGTLRSPALNRKAPTGVDYKYTIVSLVCSERPLDPLILVTN
ncbi:MAG: hypothetical protein ACK5ME_01785 [Parahaliea sp.]